MKRKWLCIILVIAMALTACSSNNKDTTKEKEQTTNSKEKNTKSKDSKSETKEIAEATEKIPIDTEGYPTYLTKGSYVDNDVFSLWVRKITQNVYVDENDDYLIYCDLTVKQDIGYDTYKETESSETLSRHRMSDYISANALSGLDRICLQDSQQDLGDYVKKGDYKIIIEVQDSPWDSLDVDISLDGSGKNAKSVTTGVKDGKFYKVVDGKIDDEQMGEDVPKETGLPVVMNAEKCQLSSSTLESHIFQSDAKKEYELKVSDSDSIKVETYNAKIDETPCQVVRIPSCSSYPLDSIMGIRLTYSDGSTVFYNTQVIKGVFYHYSLADISRADKVTLTKIEIVDENLETYSSIDSVEVPEEGSFQWNKGGGKVSKLVLYNDIQN